MAPTYVFGDLELDEARFELRKGAAILAVEPKVLGLLFFLVRERHRTVDKKELLESLWPGVAVGEASLSRAVVGARKALDDEAHQAIVTVRGRGFRFALPVVVRANAPAEASDPFASLLGNAAAVGATRARLESAATGRGSTIWITGEAGIGKGSLVGAVCRAAQERAMAVVRARCHDDPGTPPYWSWTQIARALLELGAESSVLHWLTSGDVRAESAAIAFARFDELARDLRARAATVPVVLAIEDVQWADDSSIAVLGFVGRALTDSAVLVVVTCRDSPPIVGNRGERLAAALQTSGASSVPLRGLDADEAAQLLERATGTVPSAEVVARLHQKSGGNPLYLGELLKTETLASPKQALDSQTKDLTDRLRSSIERHLEGLSAGGRETLSRAALLAESFDFGMLAAISDLPDEAVLDHLAEAAKARFLEKSSLGTYRFRHPLVRSVLSRALTGTQRASAHAAIARVLESHWAGVTDAHAEELAHHHVKSLPLGDARRALETSLRAAEQGTIRGAHERAILHYRRALESLRYLAGEEARGAELHLALARAWEAKSAEAARESYLDAALLADAFSNAEILGEAALGVARTNPLAPGREALLKRARDLLARATGPRREDLLRAVDLALASQPG